MFKQPKYKAQSQSEFFTDGATMRQPVPGTIAADSLREDRAFYYGRDERDSLLAKMPVPVTMQLLKRGQERFNIYCAPCHGQTGDGQGIMVQRGYLPPPSYHQDRLRKASDGYIFDVITNGVRNMPSYRHQIPVADRWAIVAYQRALQRSQNANVNDIPLELRESVK
jgi:cytochrome c